MKDTFDWEQAVCIDDLPPALREVAGIVGIKAALALAKREGGSSVYIHKADAIKRKVRDRRIREEYDGRNVKQLTRKCNLSEGGDFTWRKWSPA